MNIKKILRRTASIITITAICLATVVSYAPAGAQELTAEEIRDKISQIEKDNEERRNELSKIEGDISEKEENLKRASALLGEQKQLVDYYYNLVYYKEKDIDDLQAIIDDLSAQIEGIEESIAVAEKNIADLEADNADNLVKFAQIIRTMYTTDAGDMFAVLAGSADFYDLMVGAEIMGNITEQNQIFMDKLQSDIKKLNSDKKQLETDKATLEERKAKRDANMVTLLDEKAELDALVYDAQLAADDYQQDYDIYQAELDSLENQQNDLNYLISVGESDIENYEEQLKQLIIEQTQPDKVYQEGEWYWPLPGRSYISCDFGYDPWLDRIHKGIDIGDAGIYGDDILASKGGTVIIAQSSYIPGYSYGMYVVVDHGGGYTSTYAHMSEVYVYVGQEVEQGQPLGAVGNTGYSFGAHLHFEIRLNGEPMDPFDYVSMV